MTEIYVVILTILFSAFFSGMEIAFVSSNKLKIELDKNRGLFSAKILGYFVKNPSKLLGTLLLGNNIALVIYGIFMARLLEPVIQHLLGQKYSSESLILFIQTIISTIIILITAEFIPKVLFRLKSNSILNVFAVPINILYWIFYPIIHSLVSIAESSISKIFRMKLVNDEYAFTPIDLDNYIKEFTPDKNEEIEVKQEIQMLQNAIGFKSVKLRECMVPRTEISALEVKESIDLLKNTFIESGHSKILIYEESIDNIIGFVHSSAMFNKPQNIKSIVRSIPVYPETILAENVLNSFIKEHKSIAIVVDEFGGTSGIVTMEDIIEEIFGEIEDEYDVEELIEKKISDNEYLFSGRHEIDYLNENYPIDLPISEDYETLGGLIIKIHESIPLQNEEIKLYPFLFTIEEASETRIELVRLTLTK
jgi:CBS domain containing-hemolysin-like protein